MYVPISKNKLISLAIGSFFGLLMSLLTKKMFWDLKQKSQWSLYYKSAFSQKDLPDTDGPDEIVVFHKENESVHKDMDLVARKLAERVRVLCWIMTQPDNHKSKVNFCTNVFCLEVLLGITF